MAGAQRLTVDLEGVPETLLWTLHHRAVEAARPDAVIHDPLALSLVERIDYPFTARFGPGGLGQWQAVRALTFDRAVRRFAAAHPAGTVVALGEGLETQFWRVDDGRIRWLTVDLPEVVELRDRLLPPSPRRRSVAGSALDPAWIEAVAPAARDGVLVTAQGLLMYLEREEAHGLIATCARRLPGSAMVFDTGPVLDRRAQPREGASTPARAATPRRPGDGASTRPANAPSPPSPASPRCARSTCRAAAERSTGCCCPRWTASRRSGGGCSPSTRPASRTDRRFECRRTSLESRFGRYRSHPPS